MKYRIIANDNGKFYLRHTQALSIFGFDLGFDIWRDVKETRYTHGGSHSYREEFAAKREVIEYMIGLILAEVRQFRDACARRERGVHVSGEFTVDIASLAYMTDAQITEMYTKAAAE